MTEKPAVEGDAPPTQVAADAIYGICYAPADLESLLRTAGGRSKIRRLPVAQLFFGLKQIPAGEIVKLLPHITEEQWTGTLDLDLWSRDQAHSGRFLQWLSLMLGAEDAVARKLWRGTAPELWQLIWKRELKVEMIEDAQAPRPSRENEEGFETPDGHFWITLPEDADRAQLLKALLLRLYQLDQQEASLLLSASLSRTSVELEEEAYQQRRRRTEDLGFQDYFDAIEIYSPLKAGEDLARKTSKPIREVHYSSIPVPGQSAGLLLVECISRLEPGETQALLEEIFFVCNKVLSADRISPGDPEAVRQGLRKALAGINLGLDWWSRGHLAKAIEGVRQHFLQSFFQLGRGLLLKLQEKARDFEPEPGSYEETIVEALLEPQPRQSVVGEDGSIHPEWISTRNELAEIEGFLDS